MKWNEPKEVDEATLAFPANVIGELLPEESEIPDEFWEVNASNEWVDIADHWFARGLEGFGFVPKDGVDPELAFRQLGACMRSYQPKHEHKIAGVAWLLSLMFEDFGQLSDDEEE